MAAVALNPIPFPNLFKAEEWLEKYPRVVNVFRRVFSYGSHQQLEQKLNTTTLDKIMALKWMEGWSHERIPDKYWVEHVWEELLHYYRKNPLDLQRRLEQECTSVQYFDTLIQSLHFPGKFASDGFKHKRLDPGRLWVKRVLFETFHQKSLSLSCMELIESEFPREIFNVEEITLLATARRILKKKIEEIKECQNTLANKEQELEKEKAAIQEHLQEVPQEAHESIERKRQRAREIAQMTLDAIEVCYAPRLQEMNNQFQIIRSAVLPSNIIASLAKPEFCHPTTTLTARNWEDRVIKV